MYELKIDDEFHQMDLSTFNHNVGLPRHRWYVFKEGFSERLVKSAIKRISADGKRQLQILDTFAGSGTSLVTGGTLGHSVTGIEVNPFLAFATEAKCIDTKWTEKEFQDTLKEILKASEFEIPSPLETQSTFTENGTRKQWLFNKSVLRGFTALDESLKNTGKFHKPLRLALFASLMECCNAKRDGKCLRYIKDWQTRGFTSAELRQKFISRTQMVNEDVVKNDFNGSNISIINNDVRNSLKSLPDNHYDLVVTSPPYLNSFDYSDVYRPEMFVGGFVSTNEDLTKIRKKALRSHVQIKLEDVEAPNSASLRNTLTLLDGKTFWNPQIPKMIKGYFVDMFQVLQDMYRTVRRNGQAWIVVSTSAYGGIQIPVDLILADLASSIGWRLESINILRHMRSSGQHLSKTKQISKMPLRESLIIIKK